MDDHTPTRQLVKRKLHHSSDARVRFCAAVGLVAHECRKIAERDQLLTGHIHAALRICSVSPSLIVPTSNKC